MICYHLNKYLPRHRFRFVLCLQGISTHDPFCSQRSVLLEDFKLLDAIANDDFVNGKRIRSRSNQFDDGQLATRQPRLDGGSVCIEFLLRCFDELLPGLV